MKHVGGIYYRPLLPPGDIAKTLDVKAVLRHLQKDLRRRIKTKLEQSAYSSAAKKALAKWLVIQVKEHSLRFMAKHPAFMPLVFGMPRQQMTWLVKAKRPIPIVTETGELIFRSATPKSMADGKWIHPGHAKRDFIEQAKEEARVFMKKALLKELKMNIELKWSRL